MFKKKVDKIWVFFLTFLKMMDVILLSSFNEESLNQMYVKLFSDDTLKPKQNFLTHYTRIVKDKDTFYQPKKIQNILTFFFLFQGQLSFCGLIASSHFIKI